MNEFIYQIISAILGLVLGISLTFLFNTIRKKRRFHLENIRDIVNTSNKAIKIIKDSNMIMENQTSKLNDILEVLENAKHER